MVDEPRRKPTRLPGYDYAAYGGYFVTLCAHEKRCIFGRVYDGQVVLNALGELVKEHWLATPQHYPHIDLDQYVVMPNHLHGILMILQKEGGVNASPTLTATEMPIGDTASGRKIQPTSRVIGDFKGGVTRRYRKLHPKWQGPIWQRSFYDRVIRDEKDLQEIRDYIFYNPLKWSLDKENPEYRLPNKT